MKSTMEIEVSFMAGTGLRSAIQDAKNKAVMWDLAYVKFNFNGWKFSIGKNCDVEESIDQWICREHDVKSFVFN